MSPPSTESRVPIRTPSPSGRRRGSGRPGGRRLAKEIVPVSIPQRKSDPILVERDEHPRATTIEALAKLGAPFRKDGSVTAGNASGVNDGAAALLVASEAAVRRLGLDPMARITAGAVVGVPSRIMGIGPAPATEKLLARLALRIGTSISSSSTRPSPLRRSRPQDTRAA